LIFSFVVSSFLSFSLLNTELTSDRSIGSVLVHHCVIGVVSLSLSPARRSSAPSSTPVSVANRSCASVISLLAESGNEARVPSSLAGGTGERSNEAAAEAAAAAALTEAADEVATPLFCESSFLRISGLADGAAGAGPAFFFPPSEKRRVTLREELIAAIGGSWKGGGADGEGEAVSWGKGEGRSSSFFFSNSFVASWLSCRSFLFSSLFPLPLSLTHPFRFRASPYQSRDDDA